MLLQALKSFQCFHFYQLFKRIYTQSVLFFVKPLIATLECILHFNHKYKASLLLFVLCCGFYVKNVCILVEKSTYFICVKNPLGFWKKGENSNKNPLKQKI